MQECNQEFHRALEDSQNKDTSTSISSTTYQHIKECPRSRDFGVFSLKYSWNSILNEIIDEYLIQGQMQ